MQSEDRRAQTCWLCGAVGLFLGIPSGTASAQPGADWPSRVSADLLQIYHSTITKTEAGSFGKTPPHARLDASGRVQAAAYFDCTLPAPDSLLRAAGFVISASVKLPPYCVVEGWA